MNKTSIFALLGLAMKARNVTSGEFMTEKTIKSGAAKLVIVAEDASDNTKKMFYNMCVFRHIPLYIFGSKQELGHCMGKELRASLAITDEGFAKSINKKLEESATNGGS